eukprot:7378466-Prymnesium_polylepis.3
MGPWGGALPVALVTARCHWTSRRHRLIERSPEHLARLFALPEWSSVSEVARDLVTKLLEVRTTPRLPLVVFAHPWIALKGAQGAGELKTAAFLLKKEVAQKRLTAMWHVLDIINALDASGAVKPTSHSPRAPKQLPPMLAKRASQGSVANLHSVADSGLRPRQDSTGTDRMEELQNLFQMFDIDGNGTIDCDEIAALLKKLGFTPDEARIREVVNKVDTNNNGQLEFVEFCEFLKLAKQGVGLNQAVEQELDAYSAADGYISKDEISKLTRTFAETLGQHITDEDVEDVLALSIAEDDGPFQSGDASVLIHEAAGDDPPGAHLRHGAVACKSHETYKPWISTPGTCINRFRGRTSPRPTRPAANLWISTLGIGEPGVEQGPARPPIIWGLAPKRCQTVR